jgi:hypothetical protein
VIQYAWGPDRRRQPGTCSGCGSNDHLCIHDSTDLWHDWSTGTNWTRADIMRRANAPSRNGRDDAIRALARKWLRVNGLDVNFKL